LRALFGTLFLNLLLLFLPFASRASRNMTQFLPRHLPTPAKQRSRTVSFKTNAINHWREVIARKASRAGISTGIALLVAATMIEPAHASKARNIYGRVELVKFEGMEFPLSTKMDTGARTASLHAINIRQFRKGATRWVSFDVPMPGSKTIQHYEKPLERVTRIKNRNSESLVADEGDMFSERPEVKLEVCLRNELREINVNLVDRSHFVHPVLFGATAIEDFEGLIDPSMRRTVEPFCVKRPSTKKVASR